MNCDRRSRRTPKRSSNRHHPSSARNPDQHRRGRPHWQNRSRNGVRSPRAARLPSGESCCAETPLELGLLAEWRRNPGRPHVHGRSLHGQASTGRADRPKLQLGHLAERRRYPGRRAPEVNGHATGVDSDDSTQAMRIVRDKVVERVLLDNRFDVRCERTAGEVRAPAPGDGCHGAVSMRLPRLPGDPLKRPCASPPHGRGAG